jgi:hypothetical protein
MSLNEKAKGWFQKLQFSEAGKLAKGLEVKIDCIETEEKDFADVLVRKIVVNGPPDELFNDLKEKIGKMLVESPYDGSSMRIYHANENSYKVKLETFQPYAGGMQSANIELYKRKNGVEIVQRA